MNMTKWILLWNKLTDKNAELISDSLIEAEIREVESFDISREKFMFMP